MQRWYVINTQPQKEDVACTHLRRQGFEVYLPHYRRRRSHARKIEWVPTALFPRYLFVRFDIEIARWRSIQSTVGVSHLVCNGGMPMAMPTAIVDAIRERENRDGFIELTPVFQKGQAVTVCDGPLFDRTGLFEAISDDQRVTILLSILGREVRAKVPLHSIRAVA